MAKIMDNGTVLSQEKLADGIYSIIIRTKIAKEAVAGQFVSLYRRDPSRLLPRPISICEIHPEEETLRLVYRVVGGGTEEFSAYQTGDSIRLLGPLGNGFTVCGDHPILVGGGVGIPPMIALAGKIRSEKPDAKIELVMGYRSDDTFLTKECESLGNLHIATDDGSLGTHGTVIDAILAGEVSGDVIFACGPKPMLRALKEYAVAKNLPCYISMEERMACGVGACLGCVIRTTEIDDHSKVKNARVCADGPVFDAREVDLS